MFEKCKIYQIKEIRNNTLIGVYRNDDRQAHHHKSASFTETILLSTNLALVKVIGDWNIKVRISLKKRSTNDAIHFGIFEQNTCAIAHRPTPRCRVVNNHKGIPRARYFFIEFRFTVDV